MGCQVSNPAREDVSGEVIANPLLASAPTSSVPAPSLAVAPQCISTVDGLFAACRAGDVAAVRKAVDAALTEAAAVAAECGSTDNTDDGTTDAAIKRSSEQNATSLFAAVDTEGRTALHVACEGASEGSLRTLRVVGQLLCLAGPTLQEIEEALLTEMERPTAETSSWVGQLITAGAADTVDASLASCAAALRPYVAPALIDINAAALNGEGTALHVAIGSSSSSSSSSSPSSPPHPFLQNEVVALLVNAMVHRRGLGHEAIQLARPALVRAKEREAILKGRREEEEVSGPRQAPQESSSGSTAPTEPDATAEAKKNENENDGEARGTKGAASPPPPAQHHSTYPAPRAFSLRAGPLCETPLQMAIRMGNEGAAMALIAAGVDVNMPLAIVAPAVEEEESLQADNMSAAAAKTNCVPRRIIGFTTARALASAGDPQRCAAVAAHLAEMGAAVSVSVLGAEEEKDEGDGTPLREEREDLADLPTPRHVPLCYAL